MRESASITSTNESTVARSFASPPICANSVSSARTVLATTNNANRAKVARSLRMSEPNLDGDIRANLIIVHSRGRAQDVAEIHIRRDDRHMTVRRVRHEHVPRGAFVVREQVV